MLGLVGIFLLCFLLLYLFFKGYDLYQEHKFLKRRLRGSDSFEEENFWRKQIRKFYLKRIPIIGLFIK